MQNRETMMLEDTLKIFEKGYYELNGRRVPLKLSERERRSVRVFLPDEVHAMKDHRISPPRIILSRCVYSCENTDSFSMARKFSRNSIYFLNENEKKEVLVLNFANPVNPGGGVRRGAIAQEEDLCRKSSLLLSLESEKSKKYYAYNKSLKTNMGSDAIMITPKVEIIKDENGNLLDKTVVVAVMTCAAPMIRYGYEGLSEKEYRTMLYNRIMGMLRCAAVLGYKNLVLGAFGCGAFCNDAKVVSDLFCEALKEFRLSKIGEEGQFYRIGFAVLSRSENQYNFKEFYRNFGKDHLYGEKVEIELESIYNRKKRKRKNLDKIRGSLIGGAVGDALGYPVEFMQTEQIFRKYGKKGITEYDLCDGVAQISDDTQMTLFTANGILAGETRFIMRGIGGDLCGHVLRAYQDWLITQEKSFGQWKNNKIVDHQFGYPSWLLDVPELYARRAPGNTCLSALKARQNRHTADFFDPPINKSKGCGGIMRIAPLGLYYKPNSEDWLQILQKKAAEISAITHGHSLGYMPSAVLTHIINRIVYPFKEKTLREIVLEARDTASKVFAGDKHLRELTVLINKAMELSENNRDDLKNIQELGEGWVAEETLAIAIYCSLKYENDFSKGIIAAANHSGDSDSTAAVTGNILGALLGYSAIEEKWKARLELKDVILEMADDLCYGCLMCELGSYCDMDWIRKYKNF